MKQQEVKQLEKIVKTKKEKIVSTVVDSIFLFGSLFMVYKIYHETGIYTSIVATTLLIRTWFKKEVLKVSYFIMRIIAKQEEI